MITKLLSDSKVTFIIALFYTVCITILSLVSTDSFKDVSLIEIAAKDKIVHFIFYFGFSLVWFFYVFSKTKAKKYFKIFIFSVGYGILMEIFQEYFTIARTADIFDVLANTTGVSSSLLLIYYIIEVKKVKF